MCVSSILFLVPLLFAIPAVLLLESEFPENIEIEEDLPTKVSFRPVIMESVNNGIRANQVFLYGGLLDRSMYGRLENNCKECSRYLERLIKCFNKKDSMNGKNMINLRRFPVVSGKVATMGLSSKEVFQSQITGIAGAKGKEKEAEGIYELVTNAQECEGKGGSFRVPERTKIIFQPTLELEAISFLVNEPLEPSAALTGSIEGKASVTQNIGGKLEMKELNSGLHGKPKQPITNPCNQKSSTVSPQQPTTGIQFSTDHRYRPTSPKSTASESQSGITETSTKEVPAQKNI